MYTDTYEDIKVAHSIVSVLHRSWLCLQDVTPIFSYILYPLPYLYASFLGKQSKHHILLCFVSSPEIVFYLSFEKPKNVIFPSLEHIPISGFWWYYLSLLYDDLYLTLFNCLFVNENPVSLGSLLNIYL